MKKFIVGLVLGALVAMSGVYASEVPKAAGHNLGGVGEGTGILTPVSTGGQVHAQSVAGEFDISLFAIRMPLRANAQWEAVAAAKVGELYQNRSLVDDVGQTILPSYIMQPPARDAYTLWFTPRIKGINNAKLNHSMLRFTQSSYPDNSLANSYSLIGGSWVYSPPARGVIWSGGERVNDQVLMSGSGFVMVDEFDFSGVQSTFYPYSNAAEQASIIRYLRDTNLRLTTTVEVVGSDGSVLATASRTLQVVSPRLSIAKIGNGNLEVSYIGSGGGILESSSSVKGPWVTVATLVNEKAIVQSSSGAIGFFRVRLP